MDFKNLLAEVDGGILIITINRPDKLNALNSEVISELDLIFDEAETDPGIRGIILTGNGTKAFVAGADIAELARYTPGQAKEMAINGHRVFNKIEAASKPVIAAVNGFALGGGCELAMACHIRIASENAKFGQPEINLGIIPGYGGTQRLPRYVGKGKALELLLTGEMISAQEALQLSLVNYVTSTEELLPKCKALLDKMKTRSSLMTDSIIACVNAFFEKGSDGFEMEIDEFSQCMKTEDFKEGTSAFLEKRKSNFTGK